jgi:hypothetical protein
LDLIIYADSFEKYAHKGLGYATKVSSLSLLPFALGVRLSCVIDDPALSTAPEVVNYSLLLMISAFLRESIEGKWLFITLFYQ